MQDNKKSQKTEEVAREFAALEAATSPGVLEVLRVYGGYQEAADQVDEYLAAITPPAAFSMTNSTEQ